MRTSSSAVILLVVLGLCVPGRGEILVYKLTQNGTSFRQDQGQWRTYKESGKAYVVIDLNYTDNTITQAAVMSYRTNQDGKSFEQNSLDLELVRIPYGNKVQWAIVTTDLDYEGQVITGGTFSLLTGLVRPRDIGAQQNREVANKLSGYDLNDEIDGTQRDIDKLTLSLTLYPAWTNWANDLDEGNQDFTATTQMIRDYLIGKGYTEESE